LLYDFPSSTGVLWWGLWRPQCTGVHCLVSLSWSIPSIVLDLANLLCSWLIRLRTTSAWKKRLLILTRAWCFSEHWNKTLRMLEAPMMEKVQNWARRAVAGWWKPPYNSYSQFYDFFILGFELRTSY
jgi:hypothetical protein